MTSGVLGVNAGSGFLDTCLVSGVPSTAWPLVIQKSFVKIMGWDLEPRGRNTFGG